MITKIKKLINYVIDFFVFFYDLFLFRLRKKNSLRSYNIFLRLFFLTGGISNDIINFFVSKKPKKFLTNRGLLSKYDAVELKKYQENLKKNGYLILENILTTNEVDYLANDLKKKDGFYLSDKNGVSAKQRLNLDNPAEVKFFYSSQDIINTKSFQKILFDSSLINFSQEYLNSYPVIDNISSWWSFPSNKPDKNAAQWWHFDLERPKWLKFFFFMTDCTLETGAHSFVKETHKNNGINWHLRKKGYSRLSDEEINKYYKKEKIIDMTLSKGSLLIEDTRGLHKGKKLLKDKRFLIQLQFSSSAFGTKIEKFFLPKTQDKNYKNVMEEFKHTYSLFRNEQ